MAPYRNYDYGLRGDREAMRGRYGGDFQRRSLGYDERFRPRTNRVTARYNLDYVYGNQGDRYPRNDNFGTGDRMDRIGDPRWYRRPYMTTGGTWTMRGSVDPIGYDFPTYGPNYGGRYPDEL